MCPTAGKGLPLNVVAWACVSVPHSMGWVGGCVLGWVVAGGWFVGSPDTSQLNHLPSVKVGCALLFMCAWNSLSWSLCSHCPSWACSELSGLVRSQFLSP